MAHIHRRTIVLLVLTLIQWSSQIESTAQPVMFESNTTEAGTTTCSIGNETCTTPSPVSTVTVSTTTSSLSASPDVNSTMTTLSNVSVSTSTTIPPVPNSTTSIPPVISTAKPSVPVRAVKKKTDPETDLTEGNACTCDLMAEECESNCCCDPDCKPYQLTVFSSCLPRPRPLFDDRMCHTIQSVIVNNTEQLVDVSRPGALCIVRTNLAAWVLHPTRPAILSQQKFSRTWTLARSPSWLKIEESPLSGDLKPYMQDSFLWKFHPQHVHTFVVLADFIIVDSAKIRESRFGYLKFVDACVLSSGVGIYQTAGLRVFFLPVSSIPSAFCGHNPIYYMGDLPSPSATSVCSAKRPVRFLRPWSKTCLQQTPLNRAECLRQSSDFFLRKINIVSNPMSVNQTELALNKTMSCPKKLCASVFSFNCSEQAMAEGNFSSCRNVSKSTLSSFDERTNICIGVVKNLRMVVFHNGTEGIDSIMVYFSVANISTANPVLLQRSFSVNFQWSSTNSSLTKSHQNGTVANTTRLEDVARRSGHPGYIVGRPVRSGLRYQVEDATKQSSDSGKRGEDSATEEKIHLIGSQKDMLSLFAPGSCELNKRHPVLFGEDVHVSCGFALKESHFSSPQNCTELRVKVLRHLLGHFYTKKLLKASSVEAWGIVIGAFGDSNTNKLSDWIPLILDGLSMTPAEFSRTENRSYSEDPKETQKCDSVLTAMEIRILHSFVGSINNPQSKIIGASIRFEPAQDLVWHCDPYTEDCTVPLYLTTSVKFVDVSSPAVAKYAEPPGIHIRLPPDFFYPFMIAKNSHGSASLRMDLSVFICLIILTLIRSLQKTVL